MPGGWGRPGVAQKQPEKTPEKERKLACQHEKRPARLPVPVVLLITDGVMMARWKASVTTRGTKGA